MFRAANFRLTICRAVLYNGVTLNRARGQKKIYERYIMCGVKRKLKKLVQKDLEELKHEWETSLEKFIMELCCGMRTLFEGEVTCEEKTILYKLPNGKQFRVTAEQIS